jgi:hypothetical protein
MVGWPLSRSRAVRGEGGARRWCGDGCMDRRITGPSRSGEQGGKERDDAIEGTSHGGECPLKRVGRVGWLAEDVEHEESYRGPHEKLLHNNPFRCRKYELVRPRRRTRNG